MKTNDNFIFGWHFLFPQLGEEIPPVGGICKVLNTGKIRLKTIQFEYLYLLRKFPQRDDVMRHAIWNDMKYDMKIWKMIWKMKYHMKNKRDHRLLGKLKILWLYI